MDNDIAFTQRLRMIRKNVVKGTMDSMAEVLNISRSTYSKIESGKIKLDVPKIVTLYKLYGINPNYITIGIGSPIIDMESKIVHTNTFGDHAEMTNIVGNMTNSVGVVKEPKHYADSSQITELKAVIEALREEKELYKKLYEKTEIEAEFYKNQLEK